MTYIRDFLFRKILIFFRRFCFNQLKDSAASGTQEDEPYQRWKAKVVSLKEITAEGSTPFRSALWRQRGEVTQYSQSNMADGVPLLDTLIVHMPNMGNLTDVGMERVDPGLMTCTS